MNIKQIIQYLETIAPPIYQESYDNAGLIVGNPKTEVSGALCCLDATEAVIEEAIDKNCNLVVAHHPIVFKGLKRLNGKNYVERVVIKAIQHDIAIYAIHTNLDNMLYQGVNSQFAAQLALQNTRILSPQKNLKKLAAYLPFSISEDFKNEISELLASYNPFSQQHYSSIGVGISDGVEQGIIKLECLFPIALQNNIEKAIANYQQKKAFAYELSIVENKNWQIGAGMIGQLRKPMKEQVFLQFLKEKMNLNCLRHTALLGRKIETVAICGGAGGFLLKTAIGQAADIFITADYKYHEFFDADGRIIIADIGHFESEQFTIQLLHQVLSEKFSNFAIYCVETNTNPVKYYF